ncbi:MAG TPA: hypothetical protein QF650_01880 [Vicinamibacterales bacterium]|jgi:hypothetical protein|nr:hypothetical protein [Acidobacteriota bacterium]MDP7691533.1 hypothetical protein [Vicinamibacterales bacterium]HJO37332.1 hypothetical protein [Vicinamibacterales bacterium]
MKLTKSELEELLRAKKLGNTLCSAHDRGSDLAPTSISALDAELGGGLPRGELSEIVGARSSGRTGTLCAALAAATSRGELAALVDTLDQFDPESAAAAGIDLSRLLWIRGRPGSRDEGAWRAVNRALKALGLLLHAGGFGVVALDLGDLPERTLRRIPFTTWIRLPRAIEGRPTACVLVGDRPIARSAGGMTLRLQPVEGGVRWSGSVARDHNGHGGLLQGLEVAVRVIGARRPHGRRPRSLFISAGEAGTALFSA